MGRDSFDHSRSPVRNHRSSHRSPSRRERSPPRHRSSHSNKSPPREKPSSRTKSPKRPKSPISHSPLKDKPSSYTKSSRHARSRSPSDRLPVKEPVSTSPGSRSPSPRSKRLRKSRSDDKDDRSSERVVERNNRKTKSSESRSPSPRTRRLRRAQADAGDKLGDKSLERGGRDRGSGRDADDSGSHRSRQVEHHRTRNRSRSPPRDEGNHSREYHRNGDDDSVAQMKAAEEALVTKEKQKPSFELSGKLAVETNTVKGVTLLFTEPPDARKPDIRWRLYVFKNGEALNEPLYVHRQTCYLFGRERRVADIPTDHPSCSKQHAVLQYRQVEKEQPDGMLKKEVKPYIMDLASTNGTFINDNRIEAERYYELMEKDTLKFGNSSREYVLLHENSIG
ncbi:uncharacterized protein LOC143543228 [Bidens hawaiensis]|uniref:uncharacterized protein LOC143543228 n=1 Tax=Bidens hawaiensis TaxID=980011 RepID=UPI00404AD729